jgi:hypothetical protein
MTTTTDQFFADVPDTATPAPTDLMVVEYLRSYGPATQSLPYSGINRLISLQAILQTEPTVTVALRRVADIRSDAPDAEIAQHIDGLHDDATVVVVVRHALSPAVSG